MLYGPLLLDETYSFEDVNGNPIQAKIEKILGQGGFGIVYKASFEGNSFAIKFIGIEENIDELDDYTLRRWRIRREDYDSPKIFRLVCYYSQYKEQNLIKEIKNLQKLQNYPYIMPITCLHCIFQEGNDKNKILCYRMPGFDSTLEKAIEFYSQNKEANPKEILTKILLVIQRVAEALQKIHDEKMIHYDIKPANIFLQSDETPVVGDFGIAVDINVTFITSGMADSKHVAPEQLEGKPKTSKSDVYQLGKTFEECLAIPGLKEEIQQLGLSSRLDEILSKALERIPENRYEAKKLDVALELFLFLFQKTCWEYLRKNSQEKEMRNLIIPALGTLQKQEKFSELLKEILDTWKEKQDWEEMLSWIYLNWDFLEKRSELNSYLEEVWKNKLQISPIEIHYKREKKERNEEDERIWSLCSKLFKAKETSGNIESLKKLAKDLHISACLAYKSIEFIYLKKSFDEKKEQAKLEKEYYLFVEILALVEEENYYYLVTKPVKEASFPLNNDGEWLILAKKLARFSEHIKNLYNIFIHSFGRKSVCLSEETFVVAPWYLELTTEKESSVFALAEALYFCWSGTNRIEYAREENFYNAKASFGLSNREYLDSLIAILQKAMQGEMDREKILVQEIASAYKKKQIQKLRNAFLKTVHYLQELEKRLDKYKEEKLDEYCHKEFLEDCKSIFFLLLPFLYEEDTLNKILLSDAEEISMISDLKIQQRVFAINEYLADTGVESVSISKDIQENTPSISQQISSLKKRLMEFRYPVYSYLFDPKKAPEPEPDVKKKQKEFSLPIEGYTLWIYQILDSSQPLDELCFFHLVMAWKDTYASQEEKLAATKIINSIQTAKYLEKSALFLLAIFEKSLPAPYETYVHFTDFLKTIYQKLPEISDIQSQRLLQLLFHIALKETGKEKEYMLAFRLVQETKTPIATALAPLILEESVSDSFLLDILTSLDPTSYKKLLHFLKMAVEKQPQYLQRLLLLTVSQENVLRKLAVEAIISLQEKAVDFLQNAINQETCPITKSKAAILLGKTCSNAWNQTEDFFMKKIFSQKNDTVASLGCALALTELYCQDKPSPKPSFYGPKLMEYPGVKFSVRYLPLESTGGDFYEIIPLPDQKMAIVLGDVVNHGPEAAIKAVRVKETLRRYQRLLTDPCAIVEAILNTSYLSRNQEMWLTIVYMLLDIEVMELHIYRAGHPYPFLYNPQIPDRRFCLRQESQTMYTMDLQYGDCIVQYTDGLIEARNTMEEMFGLERMEAILKGNSLSSPHTICSTLLEEMKNFISPRFPQDDLTLLAFSIEERK